MRIAICLLCLALIGGCDEPPAGTSSAPSSGGSAPPPPASPSAVTDGTAGEANDSPMAAEDQIAGEGAGYDSEVASVGMGKQGRNYGGGVISEPIRQYFRAGQKIQLLQMQQTLRHFNALHDRNPESHEEFMEEIINKGGVQLPELPAGERYQYDPERGELMVERPRQ